MGKQKNHKKLVTYHGQRPHRQGKRPFACLSSNFKGAFERALKHKNENVCCSEEDTRIGRLMNQLLFDVDQLYIYESGKMMSKNDEVIKRLILMKMKIKEVEQTSFSSKCLAIAESMLRTRVQLKCSSRGFRKKLVELLGNSTNSEQSLRIARSIVEQLDGLDMDISGLCKSEKDASCRAKLSRPVKFEDRGDGVPCRAPCAGIKMEQASGVGSSDSIHLRYIPQLDSFKANMADNPCGMRLPLMSPPMKRIMNKMRATYLMEDIPIQRAIKEIKSTKCYSTNGPSSVLSVMCSTLWTNCLDQCGDFERLEGPQSQEATTSLRSAGTERLNINATAINLRFPRLIKRKLYSSMKKEYPDSLVLPLFIGIPTSSSPDLWVGEGSPYKG